MEVTRPLTAALCLLALAGVPARANGRLMAMGAPLEVRYERVQVEISERAAITRVRQQFVNATERALEGEYAFRLLPGASVSDFAIWDGDTRVSGVIRRREDARRIYENIRDRGRDPGLLEQNEDASFEARVFPIPPRADKRVEIEYHEALAVDDGVVCYRFPLADAFVNAPVREFVLTLEARDGGEIGSAWSHTPGVAVHHHDAHHVTVSFEAAKPPPGDLVVYYTVRAQSGLSVAAHRTTTGPGFVAVSVSPPPDRSPQRARDVVFVIDTSGSMNGAKIDQARRALLYALATLEPQDRFEVIRFATDVQPMAGKLLALDRAALERAEGWVRALAAGGGTNIDGALAKALATFSPGAERSRYVVFLTDGQPSVGVRDTAQIAKNVAGANRAGARLFTFGIGEVSGAAWLSALAQANRGEGLAVAEGDDLATELPRWVRKLTLPLFEDARLEWKGVSVRGQHPVALPPFFLGRHVMAVARYDAPGKGTVRFTAQVDGKPVALEAGVELPAREAGHAFLPRLWAQQEADRLLAEKDGGALPEELANEVVRLSTAYRFPTPLTSFIAVPEAEKKMLPPELVKKLEEEPEPVAAAPVEPPRPPGMSAAEYHFELALAHDRSNRPDAARRVFEHAKQAIRLDPSYKLKFQVALRNSEVARQIAGTVSRMISFSEDDELTDAQMDKYAKRFEEMLGPGATSGLSRARATRGAEKHVVSFRPQAARPDPNRDAGRVRARAYRPPVTVSARSEMSVTEQLAVDPLDARYRGLQRQAMALRERLAGLRARLENMKRLAGGKPAGELAPWVERVDVEGGPVVPGSLPVKLAVRVRHAAGQAPRVRWTAREGVLSDLTATSATWTAPHAPGAHEVTVELWTPAGDRITRTIEIMVFQPGAITYAPPFLDGRVGQLEAACKALRAELADLAAELARVAPRLSGAMLAALEAMATLP